jgi:hypothetical protein
MKRTEIIFPVEEGREEKRGLSQKEKAMCEKHKLFAEGEITVEEIE